MNKLTITWLVALTLTPLQAAAGIPEWDIVSNLGMANKSIPAFNSSWPITDECKKVTVVKPAENPRVGGQYSCGGSDPAFIGYVFAFERPFLNDILTFKAGIYHRSNWFDYVGEFQWSGPAAEVEINWTQIFRNRRR